MASSLANSPFQRSTSPSGAFVAVTASATPFAGGPCRGIYIGVTGDVTITDRTGAAITFVGLQAGVIHPIQASAITALAGGAASAVIAY